MAKTKRFAAGGVATGGVTITPNNTSGSTYPFTSAGGGSSTANPGSDVQQTFNIQPTATAAGQPQGKPMKKGGKVKCMARGGGIEVRGKTKGRMV
jgi:hypothetical protein